MVGDSGKERKGRAATESKKNAQAVRGNTDAKKTSEMKTES